MLLVKSKGSTCDTRDVKQNEEQFSFEIINKNIGNWQRATLYVEDPLEEEKIILGTGSVNQHGEEEKVVISLSLKDEKNHQESLCKTSSGVYFI